MIGKTLADRLGWTEKLGGTKNDAVNITTKIERTELDDLILDIKKCNTTAQVDVAIKEHGLSDIEELPEHIKELYEKGDIDKLNTGEINKFITNQQKYKNIADQAHGFLGVKKAIDEYNAELIECDDGTTKASDGTRKLTKAISQSNSSLGKYLTGLNGAKAGIIGYASSLATATLKTFALEAGTMALNASINFGVSFLISSGISALASFIDNLVVTKEEVKEAGEAARSAIDEIESDFDSLKKETDNVKVRFATLAQDVENLGKANQSQGKLSTDDYEEFLDLSNQLADLFPQLKTGCDDNGNAILNLSGNVDTIVGSLNNLVQVQQKLANQQIMEKMPDVWSEYKSDIENYNEEFNDSEKQQKAHDSALKKLTESKKFGYVQDYDKTDGGFEFSDRALMKSLEDIGYKSYDFFTQEEWGNGQYKINWDFSSLSENDFDKIKNRLETLSKKYGDEADFAKSEIELANSKITGYINTWLSDEWNFDKLSPDMKKVAKDVLFNSDWMKHLPDNINTSNWDEVKDWLQQNFLHAISRIDDESIKVALNGVLSGNFTVDSLQDVNKKLTKKQGFNEKNPLIIYLKSKINDKKDFEEKSKNALTAAKRKVGGYTHDEKGYETNNETGDKLDRFWEKNITTEEDISLWNDVTDGITNATDKMKAFINAKNGISNIPQTFEQAWKYIGKTGDEEADKMALEAKDELLELAEAGKLTEKAFSNSSIAENFLKATGLSAEEATLKINELVSSANQLASMKTGISSISSILGEKEENQSSKKTRTKGIRSDTLAGMPEDVKAQTKEYEHFVEVLGKGTSKMSDCKDAANKLATAYVTSGNFLAKLTAENKDYYTSVLKEMGVENAEAVVMQSLIAKEDKKTTSKLNAKIASYNMATSTEQEIVELSNYITSLDDSGEALGYYALQQQIANNNALDTSGSISNLQKLAENCGITGEAIRIMSSLISDMQLLESGKISTSRLEVDAKHQGQAREQLEGEIASTKKRLNKIIKNGIKVGASPKVTPKNPSNSKDKGGSKKDKKSKSTQQIDWIERRLKNLQDTIDFTAAKLQNLFNFQKKKSNLNDQIKTTTKLINSYGAAAVKYQKKADQIANPSKKKGKKLSKDIIRKVKTGKLNKKTKLSSLIKEYGEKDAGRIQSYIGYTDKARDAKKNRQEQITKKRNLRKDLYQAYVDRADGNISLYEQQKENAITAEKKNSILGDELKHYKESYQYQIKIAKLTNDTTEQARLRSEYEKKITDLKKEQLQNTLDENSDKNNLLEARLANAVTAEDKNQVLNDEIGIVHSDTAAYNKNYSDAISDRSNQANAASKSIKKDKSKKLTKADKKKIKGYISRNEPIPDKLINKCSPKTQEQLAKYNASLNWVEDALSKKNLNDEESKTKERELQIQQHENMAEQYQSDFDFLEAQKKNQTTAKEKNQTVDSQKSITSQIYNEKMEAARLEGNGAKEQQLQEELDSEMVAFEKEKFDNIAHYYDNLMKLQNNSYTDLTNSIDVLEARGMIVGASLYSSQIQLNNEKEAGYKEELKSLEAQLPYIKEGTDEWYDAQDVIQSCKDGIADTTRKTIELNKAIRQIPFLLNEKISTRLQLVSSEFELINKFMSNKKMFDDKTGNFTKEGTATLAAYYNQLLLAQEETKNAKTAVDEMLAAIERGDKGYEDKELAMQEYYEKCDEYLKLASTELDIQQKLIDMMKEKYQAELDYLKDIIDKRKELLDTEKEAYDYQKSIEEKTKNIGSLAKQLEASKGDDSEAGKLKLQQLQVSLDEARQDLKDTEYGKWLSDQKEMLDKLYNEYSAFIDDKLNDTDTLLKEAIDYLEDPSTKQDFLNTWDQYMAKHDFDPENDLTEVLKEIGKEGSIVSAINNLSNSINHYYNMQQTLSDISSNSATSENSGNSGNSDNGDNGENSDNAIIDSAPPIQPPQEPAVDQNQNARDNVKNWILGNKKNTNFWEKIKYENASDTQKKIHDKIYDPGKGKRYMSATGMYALQKYLKVPNLLQYLTNIGYSSGGVVEKLQKIPGMNGDDGWATLKRGEAVLTPEQTKQFQKLAQNLDVLNSSVNILPNIQRQNSNFVPNHNTTQSIDEVNIQMEFPNVINYEEFRQKLQSDPKIEKYVKSVIWDKGDLSKYKINM